VRTSIEQGRAGVDVVFPDGTSGCYDLVVGADGLGSKVRGLTFPDALRGEDRASVLARVDAAKRHEPLCREQGISAGYACRTAGPFS
jgi:2-polyprenyl-6-methoxyphenol hydroxylase-like FAD-dependent oxidoreductase